MSFDNSYINYIKRNIDLGLYTFGFAKVDEVKNYGDSWLPQVAYHQMFIFGYDDEQKVFHFADFPKGGKYTFDVAL
jgi:hypothetical protein